MGGGSVMERGAWRASGAGACGLDAGREAFQSSEKWVPVTFSPASNSILEFLLLLEP